MVSVSVRVGIILGLDKLLDTNLVQGSNSVDVVCNFESVRSDELCPGAKRD